MLTLMRFFFRSIALNKSWIHFIGMVRRGSSEIFLAKLPDIGRTSGGPSSMEELKSVNSSGQPRLQCGSICHMGSGNAYKQLSEPEGPLYGGSSEGRVFLGFRLARTSVPHKPPHPEFRTMSLLDSGMGASGTAKTFLE